MYVFHCLSLNWHIAFSGTTICKSRMLCAWLYFYNKINNYGYSTIFGDFMLYLLYDARVKRSKCRSYLYDKAFELGTRLT